MSTLDVRQTTGEVVTDHPEGDRGETEGELLLDVAAMSLTQLADHIVQTHHAYLRKELPRLAGSVRPGCLGDR